VKAARTRQRRAPKRKLAPAYVPPKPFTFDVPVTITVSAHHKDDIPELWGQIKKALDGQAVVAEGGSARLNVAQVDSEQVRGLFLDAVNKRELRRAMRSARPRNPLAPEQTSTAVQNVRDALKRARDADAANEVSSI
jgi:hypothetical protein